jgi:hypothetical protein
MCVEHCDARSAWQNHHALQFPMTYYCTVEVMGAKVIMTMIPKSMGRHAAEVMGAEAIVTTIPEPTGRWAHGMCGTFHFYAVVPPFR